MRLATMLGDAVRSMFKEPATERYPFVKKPAPPQLRGKVHYDWTTCTACLLCMKDCPADALELITLDRAKKVFVMKYKIDHCTFCAQCVKSCRSGSLELRDDDWELAALDRKAFLVYYGSDEAVATVLAQRTEHAA